MLPPPPPPPPTHPPPPCVRGPPPGIYLLFLLYLFVGVSMAADMFMDGIMQITSIMKKVKRRSASGEVVVVEEPVWNWWVGRAADGELTRSHICARPSPGQVGI